MGALCWGSDTASQTPAIIAIAARSMSQASRLASARRRRNRFVGACLSVGVLALISWPMSIVLRKEVVLQNSPDPLKPGMGARGAYMNSGSRDMGPDGPRRRHD